MCVLALGSIALMVLFSISSPHKENAIQAFGNGTYLNAATAPSIPPTTQMYKQERNANRAVATLSENIFEHLQPTKVGEPGPRVTWLYPCLSLSSSSPHRSSIFQLCHCIYMTSTASPPLSRVPDSSSSSCHDIFLPDTKHEAMLSYSSSSPQSC